MPALEHAREQITATTVARMMSRSRSCYARQGETACRRYIAALLDALDLDLAAERTDAMRPVIQAHIEELWGTMLTFADLRAFVNSLRAAIFEHSGDSIDAPMHARIQNWLFELVWAASVRFMAQREQLMHERAAASEVHHLEAQLAELRASYEAKLELLEVIRQASTPIAPVVRGILVVPLVGTVDAFRAQSLTEKLLHEIGRLHARIVILDVAGVPVFDTMAAQSIIRLHRTVRMLGARVLLVGLSPDSARTIVELGIDLSELETSGTLQDGLSRALRMLQLAIGPI